MVRGGWGEEVEGGGEEHWDGGDGGLRGRVPGGCERREQRRARAGGGGVEHLRRRDCSF